MTSRLECLPGNIGFVGIDRNRNMRRFAMNSLNDGNNPFDFLLLTHWSVPWSCRFSANIYNVCSVGKHLQRMHNSTIDIIV
ncbi:hypothetical protein D3C73_1528030 [compost metagenome]